MKEITVGELKEILNNYPDKFKVIMPIHSDVGIYSPVNKVYPVDYDSVGIGFGESSSSDSNCEPISLGYCNAIRLIPCQEICFDTYSGDNKKINNYLKTLNIV